MNLPLLPLSVIVAGIWLILHGANAHVSNTATIIFGVIVVVLAALSQAPTYLRRP